MRSIVFYMQGQYQTNEVRLWDRPDLCLPNVLRGHQGNTHRCLDGLGVNVCTIFSVLFQRLVRADRIFISYLCMCSWRVGLRVGCVYAWAAIRSQPTIQPTFRQAAIGARGQHATHTIRCPNLTNCVCAIAQIHACHCVLHALGQHQANELLLWDRPNACSLS